MKKALVIGASGGIGAAIAAQLEARGMSVTGLSRSADGLHLTDDQRSARILQGFDTPYDLVLVATGALDLPVGIGTVIDLAELLGRARVRS